MLVCDQSQCVNSYFIANKKYQFFYPRKQDQIQYLCKGVQLNCKSEVKGTCGI